MADTKSWKCKCGWTLGQIDLGKTTSLLLYSQAIHGEGVGATPHVLAVVPEIARVPVRCTHCGFVQVWNISLDKLVLHLEDVLHRPLTAGEREIVTSGG